MMELEELMEGNRGAERVSRATRSVAEKKRAAVPISEPISEPISRTTRTRRPEVYSGSYWRTGLNDGGVMMYFDVLKGQAAWSVPSDGQVVNPNGGTSYWGLEDGVYGSFVNVFTLQRVLMLPGGSEVLGKVVRGLGRQSPESTTEAQVGGGVGGVMDGVEDTAAPPSTSQDPPSASQDPAHVVPNTSQQSTTHPDTTQPSEGVVQPDKSAQPTVQPVSAAATPVVPAPKVQSKISSFFSVNK